MHELKGSPIKRIMCVADCFCPEPSEGDRWSSSQRLSVPDDDDNDDDDDDDDHNDNDEDEVNVGYDVICPMMVTNIIISNLMIVTLTQGSQ